MYLFQKLLTIFSKLLAVIVIVILLIQLIPGFILFEPLLFMVRKKVEKKRKIELKRSEFRRRGYDIVGTETWV